MRGGETRAADAPMIRVPESVTKVAEKLKMSSDTLVLMLLIILIVVVAMVVMKKRKTKATPVPSS